MQRRPITLLALSLPLVGCAGTQFFKPMSEFISPSPTPPLTPLTTNTAEAFVRHWLSLLDAGSSFEAFVPYLPDGTFEEWSYPGAEIADIEQLRRYYQQAFGMFTRNTNAIKQLDVRAAGAGRVEAVADVDWSATTAAGQTVAQPIRYALTMSAGTSMTDPAGQFPKVLRYKITRRY